MHTRGVHKNMQSLRSEHISKRLYWAMSIIILCLVLICTPLIVSSSQKFLQSVKTYNQLEALRNVADLANRISRERAPSNKIMSSSIEDFEKHRRELSEYRAGVDQQLQNTQIILKDSGFDVLSEHIPNAVMPSLRYARSQVDWYAALPRSERSAEKLDQTILSMFQAWESCRKLLKGVVIESETPSTKLSNFVSQILLLSDLRDQAGRIASNVMAHVTFAKPLPDQNLTRSLQTQHQVRYLWDLIETIQPIQDKTPTFIQLHREIETQFINQGLPIVSSLIEDSLQRRPYHLTGTQLTELMVDKFATVIDLQTYLLEYSHELAHQEVKQNLKNLLWTVIISLISLTMAIITMISARRSLFVPLIKAREMLFDLSESTNRNKSTFKPKSKTKSESLFAAIQKLEHSLQQRDALEFRLKNIAHSDSLTGLSNRFALKEYIRFLEDHPSKFSKTCLMMIDIDHFKQVNDQHGHITGDHVIQSVADCLKSNVRTSDMIVRYGGDEFLVLIENIDMKDALTIANKIRKEVKAETILDVDGQHIPFSVSIGVAIGAESWLSLFEAADEGLFKAKAKGRNAVAEA